MKILILHNRYQYRGGEDTVFEAEFALLENHGHDVQSLIFDNTTILSVKDKLLAALMALFNPRSAKTLENKIIEFQPDVIHVHNFFPIASPSIFYTADKYHIPVIMTLHNYRLICPNALLYTNGEICTKCINQPFAFHGVIQGCYRESKIQTFVLALMSSIHNNIHTWHNKVERFIALTQFAQTTLLHSSLKIDAKQLVIKPNFVEDYGFETNKEDYALFVGRLSKEKGLDTLLQACQKTNFPLYIIGSGPLESHVSNIAAQYPHIQYLGHTTKKDVISYMKKAKVVIIPSIVYETFGMIIIEAFSTGTPVLCSDTGAMSEIVQNGYSGIHFKTGDPNDLLLKLEWLYCHPNEYQQMCLNARRIYEANYTPEKNYTHLIGIYNDALSAKTHHHQFKN